MLLLALEKQTVYDSQSRFGYLPKVSTSVKKTWRLVFFVRVSNKSPKVRVCVIVIRDDFVLLVEILPVLYCK